MQFVILAAGRGRRLRPLTDRVPKPMLPVARKPLLGHVADAAVDAGASELIVVVGSGGNAIRNYLGREYRTVPVSYARQHTPSGTADAVASASELLDGPFVVLNGDNLYDREALDTVVREAPAVGVHSVPDPSEYGVYSVSGDRVTGIVEKPSNPPTNLANVGAYALPALGASDLNVTASDRGEHEFTDVIARVIDAYDVTPVEFETWLDVGRPWELLAANERQLAILEPDLAGVVHEDATVRGHVVVEEGAEVRERTTVEGPALIRSGSIVGPGAYVRGSTYLGEDVHVGHGVEVKNSVVMEGSSVGHLSYVGDSVVGQDVNLGAGTKIANLRHDGQPVKLTVRGERCSTGRRKFGAVVGHGVKTGIDNSLHPGVTLSTGVQTDPGETVARDR